MSETRTFATTNILVVGTGGQGVMTATEILAEAAIALGHDVKKTEVAGMAQRGGVVSSHLRFGQRVLSPQITPGSADVLLGFEAAEAMRWRHMLRPDGLVLMNTGRLVPPVVDLGLFDYPADPVAAMRAAGTHVVSFDASAIAEALGNFRLGNTVMLGAISDHLPFPAEVLERCILKRFASKKAELVELNRQAFAAGRRAAEDAEHAAQAEVGLV
ncbi:MAG TPA: indolepyruvate oxidoreductase subunit beta [Accumulibacter sp.]|mgnify:CR=1 FL=1|jgi:indolepyruvate ferredoxin oxidoreductase beta subunit|nr:indolepyruvate oxidoreductase subunit beta [Accumulibacter sp.]HQC80198.1 indolepyruvate oxidoreductase subunit beta [Accumulibacter sp.]